MEKKQYYKFLFIIGAIWNICAGGLFLILSLTGNEGFVITGMEIPPSLFFFHVMIAWVLVLGVGYLMVGLNLDENHGIALLGAVAKIIFFLLTVIYMAIGHANINIVLIGTVDLIFAIFFIEFVLNYKKL